MPDDKRPELDEYQKEKDEFAGAIDDIFAEDSKLTDEEINKKLDEELGKRPDTASGDATGDPEVDPDKPLVDPDKYPIAPDNKPDTDTTDWKVRAEAAEAESAKANQKMSSWDGRITAANKRVKELETELEQAKVSKPSEQDLSDTEKIEEFRKDFPELVDVVDVMERRIENAKPAKVETTPAPEPTLNDTGNTEHYDVTRAAHSDLDEIVNSGKLLKWVENQPLYIRPTLEKVYYGGSSSEVISMVAEFKSKTDWGSTKSEKDSKKATTKEDKLKAMLEVNSASAGPKTDGPDMEDYDQGAKDAGL